MSTKIIFAVVVITCIHALSLVQAGDTSNVPGRASPSTVNKDSAWTQNEDDDRAAVLSSHFAAKGGTLKIDDTKRRLGYLTLFGAKNSSLDASLDFFPARDGSNAVDSFKYRPGQRRAAQGGFIPRFALLFIGAKIDAEANNEADASMLLNTSIISIKILEEVGYHKDPDTIKYLVRLGDVALHGSADGEVTPIDLSGEARLNMDTVTLLIDSTEPDPKTKMLTDEQKKLSLMYQTKSGAVTKAYTRTVRRVGGREVSAQGFILGPLTFICCPMAILEAPFPWMWGFVFMKIICCWM